jgi:membrane-bound lytic murein transglycosylase D
MLNARFSKAFYLCNSLLLIVSPYPASRHVKNVVSYSKETGIESVAIENSVPLAEKNTTEPDLTISAPEIKLNNKEALFVRTYIKHRGDCLYNVKKRSYIPFYIIDSVFNVYELPVELKYLSVIESELKASAKSRVGARGPWQLMPGTARILGLKVNRHTDERTNYYKSTKAAARYLRDLYAQFDDWLLVLAAYNGGPEPVLRAIRKSHSRNFWTLQKYLPKESREHVKKFIATHYYFEGHGSETTLTRSERQEYLKAVDAFEDQKANAIIEEGQNKNAVPEKIPESSSEKFRRIMQESEESLNNSRKLIQVADSSF